MAARTYPWSGCNVTSWARLAESRGDMSSLWWVQAGACPVLPGFSLCPQALVSKPTLKSSLRNYVFSEIPHSGLFFILLILGTSPSSLE